VPAFPEPRALRPWLISSATAVPISDAPSEATFAVPVPPSFGVVTGAADEATPCPPARLMPALAAVEISTPRSRPSGSLESAIPEIAAPELAG
jgi:hypothetical protein